MCSKAQRDGRPGKYRWRPLFNAAKFRYRPVNRVLCSNAVQTRDPLKLAGVPQTNKMISATSGPNFTILQLQGHVGKILLLNKFLLTVDMCLSCEDIARQSCAMVPRRPIFGDFFSPAFPASRVQHISDLHSKFTLRPVPHHVNVMIIVDIQYAIAEIRRGKKRRRKKN